MINKNVQGSLSSSYWLGAGPGYKNEEHQVSKWGGGITRIKIFIEPFEP